MSYQADPFDALGKSYNALKGAAQDGAMNRAGRAYASGDVRGASNALAQGGMVGDAMALDQSQAQARRQATEDDYKMAERRFNTLYQAKTYLEGIPYEQRRPVIAQMGQVLGPLIGEDLWKQLEAADPTNENLQGFGFSLEQEADRLQLFQSGGEIIGVDRRTGQEVSRVSGRPTAPTGWQWSEDGVLSYIPGGPADPQYIAEADAARRDPPRARASGGGSRSSGGTSRSAAPARPAGRPWERFR